MSEITTATTCSPKRARFLTNRIRAFVESYPQFRADVAEAWTTRAWEALEYASWEDYCINEFGASRLRIPRERRDEVMRPLREIGMSFRAIAAATGVSDGTVRNTLTGAQTYAPASITGTDGKTYSMPSRPNTRTDLIECVTCHELKHPSRVFENGQCERCDLARIRANPETVPDITVTITQEVVDTMPCAQVRDSYRLQVEDFEQSIRRLSTEAKTPAEFRLFAQTVQDTLKSLIQ